MCDDVFDCIRSIMGLMAGDDANPADVSALADGHGLM